MNGVLNVFLLSREITQIFSDQRDFLSKGFPTKKCILLTVVSNEF